MAAAQRTPPTPIPVRAVQTWRLTGAPEVHGLQLRCAESLRSLPPFFTANHPLLAADGAWLAVDAEGGAKDAAPAQVGPLQVGSTLRVAPEAADAEAPLKSRRRVAGASVPGEGAVLAVNTEPVPSGTVVYNLELDTPDNAVYMVNQLLCMD